MKLRDLAIGAAATLAVLTVPQVASAAWGTVTAQALNLRTCASVECAKVTAIPQGARVWVDGAVGGWYHLTYEGVAGYASGRYISTATAPVATTRVSPDVFRTQPPPPQAAPFGYWWWDGSYTTWYNSHPPHDGYWHDQPAFIFGFSIDR